MALGIRRKSFEIPDKTVQALSDDLMVIGTAGVTRDLPFTQRHGLSARIGHGQSHHAFRARKKFGGTGPAPRFSLQISHFPRASLSQPVFKKSFFSLQRIRGGNTHPFKPERSGIRVKISF